MKATVEVDAYIEAEGTNGLYTLDCVFKDNGRIDPRHRLCDTIRYQY